ncbi:Mitochondrial inner membrane protein Mitofilin domain containing protein [Aphelenchoides fujianensis]|nr:Mitochondrial inner membrane protein Mitofilin domain containing protein [Aphelenchoides fujianensis]
MFYSESEFSAVKFPVNPGISFCHGSLCVWVVIMLRIGAKQSVKQCREQVVNAVRRESGPPPPPLGIPVVAPAAPPPPPVVVRRGTSKALLGLTLLTGAAVGGAAAYVYVDANLKPSSKLTEEEMNALLAHAHSRADHYKRQLTELQLNEKQNISRALEEQRQKDEQKWQSRLESEKRKPTEQSAAAPTAQQLSVGKPDNWDEEVEERLRRATAAHSENLERVVRIQKQLHDIESAQAVEEAVDKERRLHAKQVELSIEKLRGIETALSGRVNMDVENRRSKQYWLACQNLIQSIIHGQKAGANYDQRRKALEEELSVIGKACENDPFVKTLIQSFSETALKKGVYTEQDLKNRFHKVYALARRTAAVDDNGGSLSKYVSSWIQSWFVIELPRVFTPEDTLDPQRLDNREVIARTRYFVEEGDLISAVRVAQLLQGEPARIAKDWIKDTRSHLEARFLAHLLLAHSVATSIRSIY